MVENKNDGANLPDILLMRLQSYFYLTLRSISRNAGKSILNIFGMMVGVFFLCAALTGYVSVRTPLLLELSRAFPEKRLIVKPKTLGIGPVQVDRTRLNRDILDKVGHLRGVKSVFPIQPVFFPVRAEGRIFGQEISTDIVVNGAPQELVKDCIQSGINFTSPLTGEPLPVVVSRYFLDLYNLGLAQSNNLPKFNEASAIGREFNLILGESTISDLISVEKSKTITCRVVGFTPDISLFGIIIPLDAARQYNAWYAGHEVTDYTIAHVEIIDIKEMDRLSGELSGMGLMVETNRDVIRQFRLALNIISGVLICFAVCIILLVAVNLTHSESLTLIERRDEIGLLYAVGANRKVVRRLFVGEKMLAGFAAGILGIGLFTILWRVAMTSMPEILRGFPVIGSAIDNMALDFRVMGAVLLFATFWGAMIGYLLICRLLRLPPARLMR
ncbi:MAG: FtsX-like permease family protein [Candidatus Sumerlaeota bacterium]|nr:FtsX-like permease family protein [Candidatus Sumerlaeota bacterium]